MKYSILGFSQEKVLEIKKDVQAKDGNIKTLKLDVTDLLILQDIATFMNRSKMIKYTIDDKVYISITYNAIIEDLPMLDIKKQALKDRIDKLCLLGIIEKRVIKNETGSWTAFKLTDLYETLLFGKNEGVCSVLHTGCVVEYTPKNTNSIPNNSNNPNNTIITQEEKEIDKSISKKRERNELFERLWVLYQRKGRKNMSKPYFDKLTDEEVIMIEPHIKAYISVNERKYTQDFERYLKQKTFMTVVYDKKNNLVYDPEMTSSNEYRPQGYGIYFDQSENIYYLVDNFFGKVYDSYDDNTRPDGATMKLNNARGTIIWSKERQVWDLHKI